jgi:hypothetical protein
METNKRVEAVAEIIHMVSPDFTLSKRYMIAAQIVKAVENIDQQVSEPS